MCDHHTVSRPLITRTTVLVSLGVAAFIAVLAFTIAPDPVGSDDDGDPFTGRWLVNGKDAEGVEYSGSLTISGDAGAYDLQWIVTGSINSGVGTLRSGRLMADWATLDGVMPGRAGTADYLVDVDGNLQGITTVDGVEGTGAEEGFPAG